MNNNYKIFTTSWFVLGLLTLLLNDFVLKDLIGNWFTGKLSDFAGLLIFPLFWTAFFPRYKKVIFLFTASLFIIWKSPLSQLAIDGWNSFEIFSISRVLDYTDLYALAILPLSYHLERRKLKLSTIQTSPIIPIFFAAFAFGATSYSSEEEVNKTYTINITKDSLLNRIQSIDSVYIIKKSQYSTSNLDTIWISFPNDICHSIVEVKVALKKHKDGETVLSFLSAQYDCPKKDNDKEKIIKAFEEKVIKRVHL